MNPSPLPSAHSITSARLNGTAFGVLEAQAPSFWTIPSTSPADLNAVGRIQYTLEISCQTMSNQLIQCSRNQLEVYRSQTHRLALLDMERAVLAAKLEVDGAALVELSKGLQDIVEARAREVSPSRKVDAGTIGDGKKDEMLKLDRRRGWRQGPHDREGGA